MQSSLRILLQHPQHCQKAFWNGCRHVFCSGTGSARLVAAAARGSPSSWMQKMRVWRQQEQRLQDMGPGALLAASFGLVAAFSIAQEQLPVQAEDKSKLMDEMGFKHVMIGGTPQPPFFRQEVVDELREKFILRDSDIVIATYPKCGTTWMQQIVLSLLFEGEKEKVPQPMAQSPWIEAVTCFKRINAPEGFMGKNMTVEELSAWDGSTDFAPTCPRRVFKTHANFENVPWKSPGKAKIVVVTRNPKDACVSMFHHFRDGTKFQYRGDFQHFTSQLFLKGKAEAGCFWAWHAGWEKASAESKEIMWVSYEELKTDPTATIRKLAKFLEIPLTETTLTKTMAAASFDSMKQSFAKNDANLQAAGKPVKKEHIRKGEMGSWRNDIDGALLVEFDAVHALRCLEHDLQYKFVFG